MSKRQIRIPEKFLPLLEPSRYKVFYGGRGSGKSESFARALLIKGAQQKHLILCTRELQASIQDSVHRLLAATIEAEGLGCEYDVLQTVIRHKRNGTEFIFKGLKHNISEIKGLQGVTIVWAEEAENISNRSWEILIPTIRAKDSEIWISFNTKNRNDPTYERFVANEQPDSIVRKVSWSDNPFFPDVLRREMEKLKESDTDAYNHIWGGDFDIRRSGAVYAKQLAKARDEGRICKVPYDPSCQVFTAWDLGFGDSTAIWWLQFVGRELRWLESYENSGEQLDHYVQIVKSKKYNYSWHYLPHDGGHGNIRGDSVSKQLHSMGLNNIVLPRESDITPGIELLRQTIAFSAFDADNCKDGLKALESYAYEWDQDRSVFKSKPRHDWTSHFADGARYAAQAAAQAKAGLVKSTDPYKQEKHSAGWMA